MTTHNPFPGMNPYLEHPNLWPAVSEQLAQLIAQQAIRLMPHAYHAIVDTQHNFHDTAPDIRRLHYSAQSRPSPAETLPIKVRVPQALPCQSHQVQIHHANLTAPVAFINILSHADKSEGQGRSIYRQRRQRIIESSAHLAEVDLLREGTKVPVKADPPPPDTAYEFLVSDQSRRPEATLTPFGLDAPIPNLQIPLLPKDGAVAIDMGRAMQEIHHTALTQNLPYHQDPTGPLNQDDAQAVRRILTQAGLRPSTTP